MNIRILFANSQIPEVAASFLALSYQKQIQGLFSETSWQAIHAAWICDNKKNLDAAISCRKKAILLINQANLHSQQIAGEIGSSEAITIDLMRRSGQFKQALELIKKTK
ncbi:hypothetical protein [Roseofilum sp. Guam]|uniref:hypothetical protein n=1 Tax=Roseofilum sp. Guam TaxID=2821502 RepID=UPI001B19F190|nr:hypothetical protein [Roseofilum sp. Guam]MBP0031461.1 hypothetical protein [Roseofilum sp. Guam]